MRRKFLFHLLIFPITLTLCHHFSFPVISLDDTNRESQKHNARDLKRNETENAEKKNPLVEASINLRNTEESLESKLSLEGPDISPKKLPEDKVERISKGSRIMSTGTEKAAQLLSEIGEYETSISSGPSDTQIFKRQALEVLSQLDENSKNKKSRSNNSPNLLENNTLSALNDFFGDIAEYSTVPEQIILRDYSLPCPQQFFKLGNDCWPFADYSGKCNSIQKNLATVTEIEKQAWERQCGAYWKNLPKVCTHGTNWYKPCPVGWIESTQDECFPLHKNIQDECPNSIKYTGMTVDDKKKLAQRCSLRWPCNPQDCNKDYTFPCPLGWIAVRPGVCKAPKSYMGPCPRYARLEKFTAKLKMNFEIVCFVQWPCDVACERNFTVTCPLGWVELNDGFCSAPADYPGPLPPIYSFRHIPSVVRQVVAKKLHLYYPCEYTMRSPKVVKLWNDIRINIVAREKCLLDFSVPCPVNWKASSNGIGCTALTDVSTPCQGVVEFNKAKLSIQEKEDLAIKCHAQYPCRGEYFDGSGTLYSIE